MFHLRHTLLVNKIKDQIFHLKINKHSHNHLKLQKKKKNENSMTRSTILYLHISLITVLNCTLCF
jgi:hypothetical protein